MKTKVFTIVAVVLVGLLAYYLYSDLSKMKHDLSKIKKEEKVIVKPAPTVKPKPRPNKKTEVTKNKKHYVITYGRKPDVVSQPHFVPDDKKGYYQDPVTKRWYWEGD